MKQKLSKLIKTNRARHMVITPIGRVSFPQVHTPRAFEDNPDGQKTYQLDLIFDSLEILKTPYVGKKTQTPSLVTAVLNVKKDQWGADKEKWPKFPFPCFRKGDERVNDDGDCLDGYAGKIFIKAKSGEKFPPKVLGADGRALSQSEFYGGCYARAQLLARPYQFGKNFGVNFTLLQVIKVREGDKFGMPSDVFDLSEVEDQDDDWEESEEGEEGGDDDESV